MQRQNSVKCVRNLSLPGKICTLLDLSERAPRPMRQRNQTSHCDSSSKVLTDRVNDNATLEQEASNWKDRIKDQLKVKNEIASSWASPWKKPESKQVGIQWELEAAMNLSNEEQDRQVQQMRAELQKRAQESAKVEPSKETAPALETEFSSWSQRVHGQLHERLTNWMGIPSVVGQAEKSMDTPADTPADTPVDAAKRTSKENSPELRKTSALELIKRAEVPATIDDHPVSRGELLLHACKEGTLVDLQAILSFGNLSECVEKDQRNSGIWRTDSRVAIIRQRHAAQHLRLRPASNFFDPLQDGNTPLILAVRNKNNQLKNLFTMTRPDVDKETEMVITLIVAGANLDDRNNAGETALHAAMERGNLETVKALLTAGANPNLPNKVHSNSPPLAIPLIITDTATLRPPLLCKVRLPGTRKSVVVAGTHIHTIALNIHTIALNIHTIAWTGGVSARVGVVSVRVGVVSVRIGAVSVRIGAVSVRVGV
eukprot:1072821-Pyramimonas_sp.AAC.1